MMDEMLNQQARLEGRRPTILSKNDAYSSSSSYTRNIAYNLQSHQQHSQNLDNPSIYYYSTNSAEGPNHSQNQPQNSSPNTEGDTRSFIGNYTQNVAYKRTSGGADYPEDPYYYSTNTAYGANAQGLYEANVAYGVRSEDRTGEEEEEDEGEEGEIDYTTIAP